MSISSLFDKLDEIVSIDILKEGNKEEFFVGNPFYIDYETIKLLTCDFWKCNVKGIPKGCFLFSFFIKVKQKKKIKRLYY